MYFVLTKSTIFDGCVRSAPPEKDMASPFEPKGGDGRSLAATGDDISSLESLAAQNRPKRMIVCMYLQTLPLPVWYWDTQYGTNGVGSDGTDLRLLSIRSRDQTNWSLAQVPSVS